mmetsp:Transcript_23302/g.32586  ORF Transcript_23302/g.32586 Transcript_23302/m.32586 type:complete len:298 (+) Transcript_23302:82-975(+)
MYREISGKMKELAGKDETAADILLQLHQAKEFLSKHLDGGDTENKIDQQNDDEPGYDEESEEEEEKTRSSNVAAATTVASAGAATAASGMHVPITIKTTAPELKKPPAASKRTPPPSIKNDDSLNVEATRRSAVQNAAPSKLAAASLRVMPASSHSFSSASLTGGAQRKISGSSRTLSPSVTSRGGGGSMMSMSKMSMGNIGIDDDQDEKEAEVKEQFSTDENKDWGGMPGILMPPPQEQLEKQVDTKKKEEKSSNKKEMLLRRNPAIQDASEKAEIAAGMAHELEELLKLAKSGDS